MQNKGQLLLVCFISFQTTTDSNYWFKKSKFIEYDQYTAMDYHIRNNLECYAKDRMGMSMCKGENNVSLVQNKIRDMVPCLDDNFK